MRYHVDGLPEVNAIQHAVREAVKKRRIKKQRAKAADHITYRISKAAIHMYETESSRLPNARSSR